MLACYVTQSVFASSMWLTQSLAAFITFKVNMSGTRRDQLTSRVLWPSLQPPHLDLNVQPSAKSSAQSQLHKVTCTKRTSSILFNFHLNPPMFFWSTSLLILPKIAVRALPTSSSVAINILGFPKTELVPITSQRFEKVLLSVVFFSVQKEGLLSYDALAWTIHSRTDLSVQRSPSL